MGNLPNNIVWSYTNYVKLLQNDPNKLQGDYWKRLFFIWKNLRTEFFGPTISLDPKVFRHKIFCGPKILRTVVVQLGPASSLSPRFGPKA